MEKKRKYTTYLTRATLMALRRFAVEKETAECDIVEAALKKCLPDQYWQGPAPR